MRTSIWVVLLQVVSLAAWAQQDSESDRRAEIERRLRELDAQLEQERAEARDGPFGLWAGMSLEELRQETGGVEGAAGQYTVEDVPRPHEEFVEYGVVVGDSVGLCGIVAEGRPFVTDQQGSEARRRFDWMVEQLRGVYGHPTVVDELGDDSVLDSPRHFTLGLRLRERQLMALWEETGSVMKNRLSSVGLKVEAIGTSTARLVLTYTFDNFDACRRDAVERGREAL